MVSGYSRGSEGRPESRTGYAVRRSAELHGATCMKKKNGEQERDLPILQLYYLHHLSSHFAAHIFFKSLTSKSMKSHFGKIQILNTSMCARAIYVGPLFLHSAI